MQSEKECGEKVSHSLDICGILYSVFLYDARPEVSAGMRSGYLEQPQTAEICRAGHPHVPAHHAHIRACDLLFCPLQSLYRLRRGDRHGAVRDLRAHPRESAPEGAAGVRRERHLQRRIRHKQHAHPLPAADGGVPSERQRRCLGQSAVLGDVRPHESRVRREARLARAGVQRQVAARGQEPHGGSSRGRREKVSGQRQHGPRRRARGDL